MDVCHYTFRLIPSRSFHYTICLDLYKNVEVVSSKPLLCFPDPNSIIFLGGYRSNECRSREQGLAKTIVKLTISDNLGAGAQ
jgi:hypothetical protein